MVMPMRLTMGAGIAVLFGAVLTLTTLASPLQAQGQGHSAAAKQCQHGGWRDLTTFEGQPFRNQGECTSYAAHGGTVLSTNPWGRACVQMFEGAFVDGADLTCLDIGQDGVDYLEKLCNVDLSGTPGSYPISDDRFNATCSF